MLAEERLARIMKLLSQQRTATVQELCEALDASESTIRRDPVSYTHLTLPTKA